MNENERSTLEVYSVRREVRFSGVLPESSGLSEILYRIPSSYWDIPGQRGEPFTGVLPVTWREFRLHAVFEKRVVPLLFLIQLQLPEAPVVSSTLIFGREHPKSKSPAYASASNRKFPLFSPPAAPPRSPRSKQQLLFQERPPEKRTFCLVRNF
ncbi:hypothetical protein AAV35_001850 [Salimicrobium jeotgali]|uniref:Uncharacterized protein n=1 Tax=Salimicrobium jeotgali TaxID=1230341 RepID=K2GCA6_9BACI|nr:hypothetical protein AAV35_001850 [Salimicrobium jeotgali]EKE31937.1 hypothetical protein MJ3_06013 [Salimicrobium jeotgali]MBM7696121.1 hypothetical protein [Salimicrobium jeotgali]